MKKGLRLALVVALLLAALAVLWHLIPNVDSDSDIDAQLGQDRH